MLSYVTILIVSYSHKSAGYFLLGIFNNIGIFYMYGRQMEVYF